MLSKLRAFLIPRQFHSCQLAGFSLMVVAFTIAVRPVFLALDALNALYGTAVPANAFALLFFICGCLLTWQRLAQPWLFGVLTMPYIVLAGLQFDFALHNTTSSFSVAAVVALLFAGLQYVHFIDWNRRLKGNL